MRDAWGNVYAGERDLFGVDFASELAARNNATIAGQATWTVAPAGLTVDLATRSTGGTLATAFIAAGAAGTYAVTVRAVTTGGHILKARAKLVVEA